jgi:integrase
VNGQSPWQDRVNHYVAIRELGKESRKNYKYVLQGFLRWTESERPGTNEVTVTAQELAGYFDALRLRGRKPVTVSYHLQILRGFFAWLVGEGHISVDPTADFSTLRQTPLARDTLTIEELSALWHAADDPFDRTIVGLLAINSLRPDEISRALVSDLGDLDQRKILRLPSRSGVHSSLPYTVLDGSLHEAIVDQMKGRRSGPLLLRRGSGVSRRAQAIIVARLGKAAQIPIAITPSTLTFSMRAIPGPDRLSVTFPSIGPQAPLRLTRALVCGKHGRHGWSVDGEGAAVGAGETVAAGGEHACRRGDADHLEIRERRPASKCNGLRRLVLDGAR